MDCHFDFYTAVSTALFVANYLLNTKRYHPAIEFLKESLTLVKIFENLSSQCHDRMKMAILDSLANACFYVGIYDESKEYIKLTLRIVTKNADETGAVGCYHNLYTVCNALGRYDKSMKYLERALLKEIGYAKGVADIYCDLGILHSRLGQYETAVERQRTSLKFSHADGDRIQQFRALTNLGHVLCSLGRLNESVQTLEEALQISEETEEVEKVVVGCRASTLHLLGTGCREIGLYDKAIEYYQKVLEVNKKTHESESEEEVCLRLCDLFVQAQRYDEAVRYLEKAGEINSTGDKETRERACMLFKAISLFLDQHDKATEYKVEPLKSVREAPARKTPTSITLSELAASCAVNEDMRQALDVWSETVRHCESEREHLNLEERLSIGDKLLSIALHKYHCSSLIKFKRPIDALCAVEQGRARVSVECLAKKYCIQVEKVVFSFNSLWDFVNLLKKDQIIVYLAVTGSHTLFWVMWRNEERGLTVELSHRKESSASGVYDVLEVTAARNFRSLAHGLNIECEDRSLSGMYDLESSVDDEEDKRENVKRLIEDDEEYEVTNEPYQLYNMLIVPFAHRVEEGPEVVLVPKGPMFLAPFPALQDAKGKYLSDKCRIRIIPSLTTLKLITDSTPDYHNQAGALIVGDPDVSPVRGLGRLPGARQEVKEIAQLLNVSPLLGEQATKEEVLRRITDVFLIHIAAHGDAERGEIACMPNPSSPQFPRKEDFMLTMEDIAKVDIRAKLVVLSCCHSGRGKVMKAEGIVGIGRAFIASGARSVLVSLWRLSDRSAKEFMIRFYGHLVRDTLSASEALHQSMKWMRETKKYTVSDWAPFVPIGDDVTLDL